MKKGGYQILDFGGVALTLNVASTLAGSFAVLENAQSKVILLSGLVIGTAKLDDVFVLFVKDGSGDYVSYINYNNAILSIKVEDDNKVTVSTTSYQTATTATEDTAGLVLQVANQPEAKESTEDTAPTVAEFNALVDAYNDLLGALQTAGIMAAGE